MTNHGAGRMRLAVLRVFGVLLVLVGAVLLLVVAIDPALGDVGSGSDVAGLIFVLLLGLATVAGAVMLLSHGAPRGAPATLAPPPLGFWADGRDSNSGPYPPPAADVSPSGPDPDAVGDERLDSAAGRPLDSGAGGPLGSAAVPGRPVGPLGISFAAVLSAAVCS